MNQENTVENNVVERMQALVSAWEAARDRRAIFLSCYAMMTTNMLAAIQAGEFEDNAWVAALLQNFADYYFSALGAYEATQADIPLVWRLAFEAARKPQTYALQDLVLGVNAHINFDLVFALSDMLAPEWASLNTEQRQMRYRDHCRVNDIIYQTIDSVQDGVLDRYSALMELADKLLGPLDEWMTAHVIAEWRSQVWEYATRLVELSEAAQRQELRREVEGHSLKRARSILGEEGLAGLLELI